MCHRSFVGRKVLVFCQRTKNKRIFLCIAGENVGYELTAQKILLCNCTSLYLMGFSDYSRVSTNNNRRLKESIRRSFGSKRLALPTLENQDTESQAKRIKQTKERLAHLKLQTLKRRVYGIILIASLIILTIYLWFQGFGSL